MSGVPTVIVRKGGFLSALFHGVFGFLTAVVVCVSVLGFYALHVVNSKASDLVALTGEVVSGLPEWQKNLPPLLGDAFDSRRAVDYRDQIDVSVRTATSPSHSGREVAVIEVTNNGSETVTVLALNVVLEDQNGVPLQEFRTYAATPLAFNEDDWRGPLLPGSTRKFARPCCGPVRGLKATVDVAELRVWSGPRSAQAVASIDEER
jgi:hypothetical protein